MANRTANYTAFYVKEPFSENQLGAYAAKDFCYYQMFKAWKATDTSFPFIDAHARTYSVRDSSDWESTLKPRLHQRLRASTNILLILSSNTANSRALREEIDYGINTLGLPVIVIYPELKNESDIHSGDDFTKEVKELWNRLPIFRNSKSKVPVLHIPMSKDLIKDALLDNDLRVSTKMSAGDYYI